ncbi:PQQ-binding-like beta-propeller repeat protein [Edaphobacter aggregans]|uniref:outer membrane protein assembly factor BamB family protein n=1 Tax=Edaphobacter aggregans TaxID=570835 RepID=UPI0012FBE575|nr:PQQ-binding-like beta-propeller repeat protein [Edaphobacter aggregans]
MPKRATSSRPTYRWKTKLQGVTNAILPSHTTRPNPFVAGDKVFASVFAPGAVCAVDREAGTLLWMIKLDSYAGSAVFSKDGSLYATSCRTLYALDPDTGAIRWEFTPQTEPGEWIYSQPAVRDGLVFIGDRQGYFHCLDGKTGKPIWRRLTSRACNNQVNATAVIAGEHVITANNDGAVICYAVQTGETIWRRRLAAGCVSELLLLRSRVILGARSLYALDLRTGAVDLELSFPKKVVKSLTVAGSRIAVVLGTDFQSEPSAWNETSAFAGELVMVKRGREFVRRSLKGTPSLRTCTQTGLVFAPEYTHMNVIDPSDGSLVMSRRGEIALPDSSDAHLYGLTRGGTLFAEPMQIS